MNKQFTFHGMESSKNIEVYANEKLKRIERFLEHEKEPIYMHLTFTAHRTHHHHEVEFQVTGPHYTLNAHREGPELYEVINEVIDCMHYELTEAKRRRVEKEHTGIKRE